MKTIKRVSAITSSIIFILIALAVNLKDPLKFKYQNTVDKIMETGMVESEKEMFEKYPTLKEAKKNIEKADYLKIQICSKTSGAQPSLTKNEELELEKMRRELLVTRQNAEQLLQKIQSSDAIAATP